MSDNPNQEVLDFIAHFKEAEHTFLHGCCWWFAYILQERFSDNGYLVDIFHEPVEGHFVARFIRDDSDPDAKAYFFDVRGDVTDLYSGKDLENMWLMSIHEERRYGRLMRDCKYFIEPANAPAWLKC